MIVLCNYSIDLAQELRGAEWSVSDPSLAEIREEGDRVVVHAKAAGTVKVSAILGGEQRFREIRIWPGEALPAGTTRWAMHPIGRSIRDLAAVLTADGPHMFSFGQTRDGQLREPLAFKRLPSA